MKNIKNKIHKSLIVVKTNKVFLDWNYKLNGEDPIGIKAQSTKKYWWKCHKKRCQHVWKDTVYGRVVLERGCPKCAERAKQRKKIDKFDINKTVSEIEKVSLEIDKLMEGDDLSKHKLLKTYTIIRRKLFKIKQLNSILRSAIIKQKNYEISKKREQKHGE